jgi:hypothetical protein
MWTTFPTEHENAFALPPDPWEVASSNRFTGFFLPEYEVGDFQLIQGDYVACMQNGRRLLVIRIETGKPGVIRLAQGMKTSPIRTSTDFVTVVPESFFTSLIEIRLSTLTKDFLLVDRAYLDRHLAVVAKNALAIDLGQLETQRYTPRLPTTLTGELPRLYADGDRLLALLPRNYGYDLERIDPKSGKNLWKPAARLCDHAVDREALDFSDKHVFYVSGKYLYARALDDGRLLWRRTLPDSPTGWRLRRTAQALLIYQAPPPEPIFLTLPAGKLVITAPINRQAAYSFEIRALDPKDGQLLQRLDFGLSPDGGRVQFFRDMLVVTARGNAWGIRGQRVGEKKQN